MAASQGNSGIVVQGYSPTSIKGWNKIKSTLREANVSDAQALILDAFHFRGALELLRNLECNAETFMHVRHSIWQMSTLRANLH
eukprot:706863-Pelagomonas_calceolata.AAC.1